MHWYISYEQMQCRVSSFPLGIPCWNPAFDVTPANLITGGIITEKGVIQPPLDTESNMKFLGFYQ